MSNSNQLRERIISKSARIVVVGLGYVGLPLAVQKAQAGFVVTGVERKAERVQSVNQGKSYLSDIVDQDLEEVVKAGRLRATQAFDAVAEADVIAICVPTPITKNKEPDTQYIEHVTRQIVPHLHRGQLVILESTTYPGTTEEVIQPRLEEAGLVVGKDVFLAYSPERIVPGSKTYSLGNTPKVVGGVTAAGTELARLLYSQIIDADVHAVSTPKVAEMEKLLENVFRSVNIALVNELAMLCHRMNIDIWEVIDAASTKPYGFMSFYPGPGLGGHCIPVDPFYLAWRAKQYSFNTRFIELAGEINDQMPYYIVGRISKMLNEEKKCLNGARILILGVAYKRDVGDLRESPVLKIITLLEQEGAQIEYNDPYVPRFDWNQRERVCVELNQATVSGADLVVIATDHSAYEYEQVVRWAKKVFDTRRATKDVGFDRNKIGLL